MEVPKKKNEGKTEETPTTWVWWKNPSPDDDEILAIPNEYLKVFERAPIPFIWQNWKRKSGNKKFVEVLKEIPAQVIGWRPKIEAGRQGTVTAQEHDHVKVQFELPGRGPPKFVSVQFSYPGKKHGTTWRAGITSKGKKERNPALFVTNLKRSTTGYKQLKRSEH